MFPLFSTILDKNAYSSIESAIKHQALLKHWSVSNQFLGITLVIEFLHKLWRFSDQMRSMVSVGMASTKSSVQ